MAANSETPLSVYNENLPQVRRQLRLYADRVEVDAVWTMGKKQNTTVLLKELSPRVTRRIVRNRWFKNSIMIASLAAAAALVLGREGYAAWLRNVAILGWIIAAGGLIVAINSAFKRQFALFTKKDGKAGLDFCNAGPDKERFEEFIAQVQKAIRS